MAETSRIDPWKNTWEKNDIPFHESKVHSMLQKHISKLHPESKGQKFFVPLCGKTLDMKWLLDQGYEVVGLDGVRKALQDFYSEHSIDFTEEKQEQMGADCHVLKGKSSNIRLYLGDIFNFNSSVEGTFDCVWDRGSLVALDQKDVSKYAEIIKDILKPSGKCMVEVFEYGKDKFAGVDSPRPRAVFEDEIKSLYEPACSVERLERVARMIGDKEVDIVIYLITKK